MIDFEDCFLKYLWRFVHEEVFPWRFFYCWRFSMEVFFLFFNFFVLWDCFIVKICSILILRLKNCFSLLVLRLKIFVLVIWLRVIGLGLDFKMDANSRLELGILIDLGLDLKFEIISRLWLFIWAGFLHNWVDFVVSWCVSKIWSLVIALWSWVWLGLFDWNGYGQIGLVLLKFCNFWDQWFLFF